MCALVVVASAWRLHFDAFFANVSWSAFDNRWPAARGKRGAVDDRQRRHYAAGASTTLRFACFRIPLALTYQIARRLVDDRALTQFVGLGPDL
jgi:hypothetical protein